MTAQKIHDLQDRCAYNSTGKNAIHNGLLWQHVTNGNARQDSERQWRRTIGAKSIESITENGTRNDRIPYYLTAVLRTNWYLGALQAPQHAIGNSSGSLNHRYITIYNA
ncbi:hypothetical protein BBBOND_0102730 [Babesia bigemina]|uniref:Uncharacterized protein n=1 Tax=Babesia bigemina TaxID=5866 RepID=A0A061CZ94_BABBI|nr:hypothetical protein BBBOND_0102730 [Babesia bigemina]CDR93946.1 hypothetical protein BBBOND_0102730 [Babesia bigemina]|eukprot:XP_012766132.1 hypothetical protein BBBOND_0102730 [Babesia bigemina]